MGAEIYGNAGRLDVRGRERRLRVGHGRGVRPGEVRGGYRCALNEANGFRAGQGGGDGAAAGKVIELEVEAGGGGEGSGHAVALEQHQPRRTINRCVSRRRGTGNEMGPAVLVTPRPLASLG